MASARPLLVVVLSLLVAAAATVLPNPSHRTHQPTGHHAGRSSVAAHLGQKPEDAARAVRLNLAWTVRTAVCSEGGASTWRSLSSRRMSKRRLFH
jgi:hypothetical protein